MNIVILNIKLLIPIGLVGILLVVVSLILRNDNAPEWIKRIRKRLPGDTSTDAPPPDVKKKKKGK